VRAADGVRPGAPAILRGLACVPFEAEHGAAVLAVMLGVALAFSVHLINGSALSEFAQAARTVGGQSDLEVRAPQGRLDENLYPLIAQAPAVAAASPVLELATHALVDGQKVNLRVLGMDALRLVHTTPALMPQPDTPPEAQDGRFALFAPAANNVIAFI
jgi:putative ABC transport system permease protein